MNDTYKSQVSLLVRILPHIAKEKAFALKGGTAINLFYRDMPRLSVDIDLTYLPIKNRPESLEEIDIAFRQIAESIERGIHRAKTQRIAGGGGNATRLLVRMGGAEIKIETSPVARGTIYPPNILTISESVESEFGFAEMQLLAFEDLFGSKLHATLDRQHPRDLFDIKLLYENEGLSDSLFRTFLIYISCSPRPAHELLNPNMVSLEHSFAREFEGMTKTPILLKELESVRERLVLDIRSRLDGAAKQFLLALHEGRPDFNLIGLPQAAKLPAVKWKLINLEKLKNTNLKKHTDQKRALELLCQ